MGDRRRLGDDRSIVAPPPATVRFVHNIRVSPLCVKAIRSVWARSRCVIDLGGHDIVRQVERCSHPH